MHLPPNIPAHVSNFLPLKSSILHARSSSTPCGFEGNNDIYGPGIRVGIYSQILAVWIANYFLSSEAQVLRDSVSIFSLAILIISFLSALRPSDVYAVEEFILLQILAWSCLMSVSARLTGRERCKHTILRRCLNEGLNIGMVGLQVWFWWAGVTQFKETPCGTYLMYVIKTNLLGWARELMKWVTLLYLVSTVQQNIEEATRAAVFLKLKPARKSFEQALKDWAKHVNDGQQSAIKSTTEQLPCGKQDPSPSSCSSSLSATSGAQSFSTTFPDLTILEEVYNCEQYIQNCVDSRSPYARQSGGKPMTPLEFLRSFRSNKKDERQRDVKPGKDSRITWLHCHRQLWKSLLMLRFPMPALVLYSHLMKSKQMDPVNGPFQLYAALTYGSTNTKEPIRTRSSTISWPSVFLASNLLLMHPSTPKRRWLFWYYALCDLLIHVAVILQLELTLHWNSVSGLTELWDSVGQLVPFIIGVGGLLLILGRCALKWWDRNFAHAGEDGQGSRKQESAVTEREKETEIFGLKYEVREKWLRWKEAYEGLHGLRQEPAEQDG